MKFNHELFKQKRKDLFSSQSAFGEAAGIDQRQVSRYETGINSPYSDNLAKISRTLNTPENLFLLK